MSTNFDLALTLKTGRAAESTRRLGDSAKRAGRAFDGAQKSVSRTSRTTRTYRKAVDGAARSSRKAAGDTSRFGSAAKKADAAIGKMIRRVGAWAAGLLAVGTAFVQLQAATGVFAQFEQSMASVQAVTQATRTDMVAMTSTARDLGETTRFSASEAASGMEFLGRAGFEANQIIGAMPGVLNLAAAAKIELGQAADISSNIMSAFNLEAERTAEVADKLSLAAASSNIDVTQLGAAMKFAAPVASALNRSLSETIAAVGLLGDVGLGDIAGRGLRTTLSSLAKLSDDGKKALSELGLTAADVDPQVNSLATVFTRLGDAGLTATQAFRIFGNEGASVALSLASNADRLSEFTSELDNAAGTSQRMADIMNDTLAGAAAELRSVFESLQIDLAQQLVPALRQGAEALKSFLDDNRAAFVSLGQVVASGISGAIEAFSFLSQNAESLAIALGSVAAALALVKFGPILQSITVLEVALSAAVVQKALFTKATVAMSGAINTLTTSIKANPVLWGGTAVIAALTLINAAVKDWGEAQERETARIVKSTEKVRQAHEKTFEAINSGSLKSMEIQRRLNIQQRASIELQIRELEVQKRLAESDARIALAKEQIGLFSLANQAAREYSDQIEDLRSQQVGLDRDQAQLTKSMEIFQDVIGDVPDNLSDLRKELEDLRDVAKRQGLRGEVDELTRAIEQVDEAMKKAGGGGGGGDELKSLFEELGEEISFLTEQASLMEEFHLSAEDAALALQILRDHEGEVTDAFRAEVLEQIKALRELEAAIERIENMPPPTIGENIPTGTVFGSQDDFFDAVGATAAAEEYQEAQDEAEKFRKIQEKNLEIARDQADAWRILGREIADALGEAGSELGDLIVAVADGAAAWKEYAAAKRAGDEQAAAAAQQQGINSAYGAVGSYLGSALAGGGTSGFGGELAGTYSAEGAEIGGYFGGYWAAVGAIVGALFKKSGDEAEVAVRKVGDEVEASVVYAEGGLSDAANDLAAGFSAFIDQLQSEFGIAIDNLGGLQFKFTERGVLEVSGDQIGSAGFRTLGEAAAYAAEQLLSLNAETNNLGENMTALLQAMGGHAEFETLEELYSALRLAAEADGQVMGEQLAALQAITEQRAIDMDLANRLGLSYEMVLAVTDRRIAQIRKEVEALQAAHFGAQDFVSSALELVQAMESFNAGIEAETKSRQKALSGLQNLQSGLDDVAKDSADTLNKIRSGGGGGGKDSFSRAADGMERAARAATGAGAGFRAAGEGANIADRAMRGSARGAAGMADALQTAKESRFEERKELLEGVNAAERNREAVDALRDSMEEIPKAFSPQDIIDVWEKAASDAGLALLSLVRQVRGEEYGAAQERALATAAYRLQLAVQLQAVYQLLEATELLKDSTRAILLDLAAQAESILGDDTLSISVPRGGGGGGSVDTGAQQRREFREEFMQDLSDTREILHGIGAAGVEMVKALRGINESAEEARRMGVAEEAIAEHRRQQLDLLRDDFTGRLRGVIGEEVTPRSIFEQYQDEATQAWILAGARAREFGTVVEEEMASLAVLIREAFGTELAAHIRGQVDSLVSEGDLDGIIALRTELDRLSRGLRFDGDMVAASVGGDALTMRPEEFAAALAEIESGLHELQSSLVQSFNLPIQRARDEADDFGRRLILLRRVIEETGEGIEVLDEISSQANNSLLGMVSSLYDQLGATEESEAIKQQLAQATFELELMQARILYDEYLRLGVVSAETQARMEEFFAFVQGVNIEDFFTGSSAGGGYNPTSGSPSAGDDFARLLEQIDDGIAAWLALEVGPATRNARQLLEGLSDMRDLLDETLGTGWAALHYDSKLAEIEEAFAVAVRAFVDETLEPFEDSDLSDIERQYQSLVDQFNDIAQAFQELNVSAEDMARLAEAQQAALEAFWLDATSGIRSIIDSLTRGPESGRAPMDLLAEQQATVADLVERALGGDLSALETLDSEAQTLLDLIDSVYGSGAAGGLLREQLLAMLESVADNMPDFDMDGDTGGVTSGDRDTLPRSETEPYVVKASDLISAPLSPDDVARYVFGPGASVSRFTRNAYREMMRQTPPSRPRAHDSDRFAYVAEEFLSDFRSRAVQMASDKQEVRRQGDAEIVRAIREEMRKAREQEERERRADRKARASLARESNERSDEQALFTVSGIVNGLKQDSDNRPADGGGKVMR